jgi:hypothetical protein
MKGRTIYFLDWIEENSGLSKNEFLENMKPENQGWEDNSRYYYSINEFFRKNSSFRNWLYNAFGWLKSKYKPKIKINDKYVETSWHYLDKLWNEFISENINKYVFKFAREDIQNFKIIETNNVKTLKQKKL